MKTLAACSNCHGTKHVYDRSRHAWVKCECLQVERARLRYRKAGLPERHAHETWRSFASSWRAAPRGAMKGILDVAKTLKGGALASCGWPLIHGPAGSLSLAASLLMRSALDGGFSAMITDLPTMIDQEFQPGRGKEIYGLQALALRVGQEPPNKFNKVVLERALSQRTDACLFTVVLTERDPTRLGLSYKSVKIEEALRDVFFRVDLTPRRAGKREKQ